ncbi:MAG TPA: methenyltetrahydromethanopterin cyclohydrolase [Burkholderiaceae bacterium]|nr:methenyltetrahydromethanopterin cyclohydrolase [Burkholderiaceae bacterium]
MPTERARTHVSVNELAHPLLAELLGAPGQDVLVRTTSQGVRIVDAGIEARSSTAAGAVIAAICMGGLGRVVVRAGNGEWPTVIEVGSTQPVIACLASQYAGWSLAATKEQTGGKKFFALGSGPARALACKEPLFEELGYRDQAESGVLVLETDREPPAVIIDKVLRDCGLEGSGLTVILTPTTSAAGTTQVVGRVLEVALHKAHHLRFPLASIIEGIASAPLPSPAGDGTEAMGRTNDAILYGGRVHLTVDADDAAARALAHDLPSLNSRDYGRTFAEIFRQYDFDFYKIDPALFAPAEVWVSNRRSGQTWHGGRINPDLLRGAWLQEA